MANIGYNFDTRRFEDANGNPVSDQRFVELAAAPRARAARAGRATLKRTALLNTLVSQENGEGRQRILGSVLRQRSDGLDSALKKVFYSRRSAPAPETELAKALATNGVAENLKVKVAALEKAGRQAGDFAITSGQLLDDFLAGKSTAAQSQEFRLLKILQDTFRSPIALVTSKGEFGFNGVFHDDTIWLDAGSDIDLLRVFGHELSHRMEADNPGAYKALLDAMTPMLRNAAQYEQKYSLYEVNDAGIAKEMVGDVLGDNFGNPGFWDQVAANTSESNFRRILTAVRSVLHARGAVPGGDSVDPDSGDSWAGVL